MTELLLLLLALLMVAACGLFVAAEFSFVTVDRSTVDRAASSGDRGAEGVQRALRTLSTQLSGAQVGITITNLAIGYLAEPALARLLQEPLADLGLSASQASGVAFGLGFTLATGFTMIFGELVPKNLAIARPLATARGTQLFMRAFTGAIAVPIRWLNGSANGLVRALGIEPQEELRSARTSEEFVSLAARSATEGTLDSETAHLVQRSVAFGPRMAAEIMTPRVQMVAVDVKDPVTRVIALSRATGYSKFPVTQGASDNVVGVVHVKQAVALPWGERSTKVRDVMVPPTVVPGSLRLDPLLTLLRGEGFQLAVVVDEYGGTDGVVTLEDVIEEIVGEIADEHDRYGSQIRARKDGSWTLSAMLRPDEVADVSGVSLPEHDDYDTVGGLIMRALGRVPVRGDSAVVPLPVEHPEDGDPPPPDVAELTVERMDGLRVDRVRMVRRAARPGEHEEASR
ncbi:hemolysin family protein [Nocardioides massiliensis]|uniref:CBS domain containing-hemolysin-like protein n=1 Tax=Nocardioides massiliensis TaxID=1325935 RepID=A0ABT9NQD5_9ACTN|nr:hemolysin family protein [Nocardioides massiliensis]MDP9822482.1 CBS domain containing-hemolysin-like protein [Nocardioides massiliensis]